MQEEYDSYAVRAYYIETSVLYDHIGDAGYIVSCRGWGDIICRIHEHL